MSDISRQPASARARPPRRSPRPAPPANAAARVLAWLEAYIRDHGLTTGDALPNELEIAAAVAVSRSSVREALTVLKVLGISETRRKGGIRLVRPPVLLELRHFFAARLATRAQYREAMEFRAALEWGLGPLTFAHTTPAMIRELRHVLRQVADAPPSWAAINAAEVQFHTTLTAACGNRLATLFAHLYVPLFQMHQEQPPSAHDHALWLAQHGELVATLEARNEAAFLAALQAHTHPYMRLGQPPAPATPARRETRP